MLRIVLLYESQDYDKWQCFCFGFKTPNTLCIQDYKWHVKYWVSLFSVRHYQIFKNYLTSYHCKEYPNCLFYLISAIKHQKVARTLEAG